MSDRSDTEHAGNHLPVQLWQKWRTVVKIAWFFLGPGFFCAPSSKGAAAADNGD
jgi:hypothetical protein